MPVEYNILFRCFILCRFGEYHKAAASGGGGGGALLVGQSGVYQLCIYTIV